MDDPIKTVEFLKQLELKNQEILEDNRKIIHLDSQRNQAREASKALEQSDGDIRFFHIGPMFIKLKKNVAQDILKKDFQEADVEINKIRSDLKVKMNDLRDMKRQPAVPGLFLKPMSETVVEALGAKK